MPASRDRFLVNRTSLVLFGCGLFIFQYMERRFAGIV